MTFYSTLVRVSLLAGIAAVIGLVARPPLPSRERPPSPHLAVLVVFDQMRGDYLMRWRPLFGKGGFRRLQDEGAWYVNCNYPYSHTVTSCGHAALATGCPPSKHGIPGNDWYDPAVGASVNCVATDRYELLPPVTEEPEAKKKPRAAAPDRLRAPTLGDALKSATDGNGRVVSLSYKSRSAVLPGGQRPDACYWVDDATGMVVTSTYYRQYPHTWATQMNRDHVVDRWRGSQWTRLRSDLDYARYAGSDYLRESDIPLRKGVSLSPTFPHSLTPPSGAPANAYGDLLYLSPFGNEVILEMAKRAIDGERLGQGPQTDLLCVSFSCTDSVGHVWGPDSQEVLDVTLRADRIVQELLDHLDARVGKGRYVLALSADHGGCSVPEVSQRRGKQAMRLAPKELKAEADAFLHAKYGAKDRWLLEYQDDWFFLNHALLAERGVKAKDVADSLVHWLESHPGIARAYTREQLLENRPADTIDRRVQQTFIPDRTGDVMALPQPYCFFAYRLLMGYPAGTSHGTPYPYDTHVPLLVYGPGIPGGVRRNEVTPLAASVILADVLGIPKPANAEASVPASLRRPAPTDARLEVPAY